MILDVTKTPISSKVSFYEGISISKRSYLVNFQGKLVHFENLITLSLIIDIESITESIMKVLDVTKTPNL